MTDNSYLNYSQILPRFVVVLQQIEDKSKMQQKPSTNTYPETQNRL